MEERLVSTGTALRPCRNSPSARRHRGIGKDLIEYTIYGSPVQPRAVNACDAAAKESMLVNILVDAKIDDAERRRALYGGSIFVKSLRDPYCTRDDSGPIPPFRSVESAREISSREVPRDFGCIEAPIPPLSSVKGMYSADPR